LDYLLCSKKFRASENPENQFVMKNYQELFALSGYDQVKFDVFFEQLYYLQREQDMDLD
jgi:hypothetical protein